MRSVIRQIKTTHPLKNITRRVNYWEFQKNVDNRKHSELFYDKNFRNNPAKSLQAALNFRDGFNR